MEARGGKRQMRKLTAYVHIKAPVQAVRELADRGRLDWMVTRQSPWLRTLNHTWQATEINDGTRFVLQMEYQGRLAFIEPFVADSVQASVTSSLGRLKQLAEQKQVYN